MATKLSVVKNCTVTTLYVNIVMMCMWFVGVGVWTIQYNIVVNTLCFSDFLSEKTTLNPRTKCSITYCSSLSLYVNQSALPMLTSGPIRMCFLFMSLLVFWRKKQNFTLRKGFQQIWTCMIYLLISVRIAVQTAKINFNKDRSLKWSTKRKKDKHFQSRCGYQ